MPEMGKQWDQPRTEYTEAEQAEMARIEAELIEAKRAISERLEGLDRQRIAKDAALAERRVGDAGEGGDDA